ncbi:MAG: BNR-4 repeat-containing protein [Verrucomicrobiia bacterium]|jgi:hypothetical protein
MNRREFSKTTVTAALAASVSPSFAKQSSPADPQVLSTEGCGRATGYAEANKIVTVGETTHVAWLDSPPEGFRVRMASLNRKTGRWSPNYTVGEAYDNHGGPALTTDADGYLHVVYHPHHHPFRYRRSKRPNDASEWEEEIQFGERLTYPTMLCGKDGTLYFSARRRYLKDPWTVEFWKKPPGRDWELVGTILTSRHKGYAHFQESLCWGPDHKTIHLCCRLHEFSDKTAYGRFNTVAYMKSDDFGQTWRKANGSLIEHPGTAETLDVIAKGGVNFNRLLRAGCLAVDAQNMPHLIYSAANDSQGDAFLVKPDERGEWTTRPLAPKLPAAWRDQNFKMAGGLAFDTKGTLHGVGQLQTGGRDQKGWGDPSNEIVKFEMRGPDDISFRGLSKFDSKTPHWLPNLERPTGHNLVPTSPGVIFTGGSAGAKNTELISNKVYWNS